MDYLHNVTQTYITAISILITVIFFKLSRLWSIPLYHSTTNCDDILGLTLDVFIRYFTQKIINHYSMDMIKWVEANNSAATTV